MQTGIPIAVITTLQTITETIDTAKQDNRLIDKTSGCKPKSAVFTNKNEIILYAEKTPLTLFLNNAK